MAHHAKQAPQRQDDLPYWWPRIRVLAEPDEAWIRHLRLPCVTPTPAPGLLVGERLPMLGKLLGCNHVHTTGRYARLAKAPLKSAAT